MKKLIISSCAAMCLGVAALALPLLAQAGSLIDVVVSDTADGNLSPGDSLRIYFGVQTPYVTNDFIVNGPCTINGRDVAASFTDATDGTFYIEYVVSPSDTVRAPGTIPFSCALQDVQTGGTETVSAFTVPTEVSINWTGATTGTVDTGALAGAVSTAQSSLSTAQVGTAPGDYPQAAIDTYRSAIAAAQITLNDLTSTQNDVDTALSTLNTATSAFNAAQVPTSTGGGNGGGNNGGNNTGNNNNSGNSVSFDAVTLEPDHDIRSTGYSFLVNMQAPSGDSDMTVSGPCTVNGVDVSNTLDNRTDGLYNLTYVVGPGDANQGQGQIPISCVLHSPSTGDTVTASTFTDHNTAGVKLDFVSAVTAMSSSAGVETIQFRTAKPTYGRVEYTLNGDTETKSSSDLGTIHTITLTGLKPDATYDYEAIAEDTSGVEGTSPERLQFTVSDATVGTVVGKPAAPTNLVATPNIELVDFAWNPPSSVGPYLIGYKGYRDGVQFCSSNTNYCSDFPPVTGKTYHYTVTAYYYSYTQNLGLNTESDQSLPITAASLEDPAKHPTVVAPAPNVVQAAAAAHSTTQTLIGRGGGGHSSTPDPTPALSSSSSPTPSPTVSPAPTPSPSSSPSPSPTATPTAVPSPTPTPTISPSSPSPLPSVAPSPTVMPSPTAPRSNPTPSPSSTPIPTPSVTPSPSPSPSTS